MSRHALPWAAIVGVIIGVCGLADSRTAHAGDVDGKIVFKPNKLGSPPARNQGFLERIENPLRPVRKFDPRPLMVVVLVDGPVDEDGQQAPAAKVRYALVGQSFEQPLLPVIAGTRVELVNYTAHDAMLFTPDHAYVEEPALLKPRGMHEFKVTTPGEAVLVRARDAYHPAGRVVVFPHRYHSLVGRRGKFAIKNVPEGTWKLRVWYRDGWLDGVEYTVESAKRTSRIDVEITPDKVRSAGK